MSAHRRHTRFDVAIVRLMRAAVVGLGFTVPFLADPLSQLSEGHRLAASIALWSLWAVVLLSILVPASSSLTALRLTAPAHLVTTLMVTSVGGFDMLSAIALALGAVVVVSSASGEIGTYFIQSSAYGDEHRFPLRCPRPHLVVVILAWSTWFATAAIGSILLAAGVEIGSISTAIALAGFVVLPRRFHRYARRWLVSVPAGLVIHDPVVLTETVMFPKRLITDVDSTSGHFASDDAPFDLSGGIRSSGIVIRLADPETVILAPTKDHPGGQAFHVRSVRICPTRIGRTLTLLRPSQ